jgi:competence protein ComEC
MRKIITKFRAFQLDSDGSLFSHYKEDVYTLIEARLPKGGLEVLQNDLKIHGKTKVDVLHITSWDNDHCNFDSLIEILNHLRPDRIEIPEYDPDSNEGKLCKRIILGYDKVHEDYIPNVTIVSRDFINGLPTAQRNTTSRILYEPDFNSPKKNDWSLIMLFRSLGFNTLSLGDCESIEVSRRLSRCEHIIEEMDVLILPHHGADNGFITGDFLDAVKPKIAVCSSNNGNPYDHPRQNIRSLLSARNIPLMTTKRGDVIIGQWEGNSYAVAMSYQGDNREVQNDQLFYPKRYS